MQVIIPNRTTNVPHKIRVAAYCRVSSKELEEGSLNAQKNNLKKTIKKNPDWVYSGTFWDLKSGRQVKSRKGLDKLLLKCRQGYIDCIYVKSISRFSRNTLDFLTTIRELSSIGVDVCFEIPHIHTLHSKGEVLITILSALAQCEGHDISENTKWGIERSVASSADSPVYNRQCYGYRLSYDKKLEIYEKEAVVVRFIYELREKGHSPRNIIKELAKNNIPSPTGKPSWSLHTIQRILSNEKYKGDVLFYKTYCDDYPSTKRKINKGVHAQYLVENHHEAIIKK